MRSKINYRKNSGFTLLELMIVIGFLGFAALSSMQLDAEARSQALARQLGVELYQYNNAVRSWVAHNQGSNGTFAGTSWLKDSSCGGTATQSYLSCSFNDSTRFGGLSYQTVVSSSGSDTIARTIMPPLLYEGVIRPDLSGLAVFTASGGTSNNLFPGMVATDAQFASDPATAVITFEASNISNNEAWLRTDGSNTMKGRFVFNPANNASKRSILNLARIVNQANEAVRLGNNTIGSSVIINADAEVLHNLTVRGNIDARSNVIAGGQINSGQNAIANRDAKANRNLSINGTLNTAQANTTNNTEIGNDLNVSGNLVGSGALTGRNFNETNVDVSGMTRSENLTATGMSQLNSVSLEGRINDASDNSYYLDPSDRSSLNRLSAELMTILNVASAGANCAPNGGLARTNNGTPLNCLNGKWASVGSKGGRILGVRYYNTRRASIFLGWGRTEPYSETRFGAWSSSLCRAQGGLYFRVANSSRYSNSGGGDNAYFCIAR